MVADSQIEATGRVVPDLQGEERGEVVPDSRILSRKNEEWQTVGRGGHGRGRYRCG